MTTKRREEEHRRLLVYPEIQKCIENCQGRLKDDDLLSVCCAYMEREGKKEATHLIECGEFMYRVTFERGIIDADGNFIRNLIIWNEVKQ